MTKETTEERVRREGLTSLAQQVQAGQLIRPAPTSTPSIVPFQSKEQADEYELANKIAMKSRNLMEYKTLRDDFAIQMLASLVNASRQNGTLPNADMMAVEAIKYADALIAELSK